LTVLKLRLNVVVSEGEFHFLAMKQGAPVSPPREEVKQAQTVREPDRKQ
jgi:hypothetical protein